MVIATNEKVAIDSANIGKMGYIGTLNGLFISGSFLGKAKKAIMEMMYSVSAPKHAMVMISPVFPVSKAKIPMAMFTMSAFAGVLVLGCTFPKALLI